MTSGRALLNPKAAEHLARLLGMTGSNHDGEVVNAARAADRFVRQLGLRWPDVIVVPPAEWQTMALACAERINELDAREADFVRSMSRWRHTPSDKQLAWLESIYERLMEGAQS